MFVDITMPPATAAEKTIAVARQIDEIIKDVPEIEARSIVSGFSFMGGTGSPYAMVILKLKPFDQRKEKGQGSGQSHTKIVYAHFTN